MARCRPNHAQPRPEFPDQIGRCGFVRRGGARRGPYGPDRDGGALRHLLAAAFACAACLAIGGPGGARSQPMWSGPVVAGLPARDIVAIVRASGYEPSGRPVRRPGIYVVRALDPGRHAFDLTLDARSGRIVAVRPVARAVPMGRTVQPPYGAYRLRRPYVFGPVPSPFEDPVGFEDATGALPAPPRAIPSAGRDMSVRAAAVLPLPRPRPVAAEPAQPAEPAASPVSMPPVTPLE